VVAPAGARQSSSRVTRLRRFLVPARIALARVRARPDRVALVALGIVAAAAALAAVLAASLAAQDRSLARRLAELPEAGRAVRASWFGVPGQAEEGHAALDGRARAALAPAVEGSPVATALFRESTIAGVFVGLGAVDGLAGAVRLRSGRLPRPCRPRRCEVVQVLGGGRLPSAPGLRLVRVGRAELRTDALFAGAAPAGGAAVGRAERRARGYHRPAATPVVLAEGVDGLVSSPVLRNVYRTYAWTVALEPAAVHPWGVRSLAGGLERAQSALAAASSSFAVSAPVEELLAARESSRVAGRRLLLLGGEAAVLLLAFAALAGARMRADVAASLERLTWLGARRWQLAAAVVWEAAFVAAPAAAAGWLLGAGAAAVVAERAGSPPTALAREALLTPTALVLAALLALAALLTTVVAATVHPARVGGLAISPLDVAALAAVAVVAAALARGEATPEALARERGTGTLLLLLPGLIAFAAAVATARVLVPLLRGLERLVPGRLVALRLAALSLARAPGYAAVAVAFLVVSVGLALFAETYRATLVRGHADQAAFAVPTDLVLREDLAELVPVRTVATPARLGALAPGVAAFPAMRQGSSLGGAAGSVPLTVLGVESAALGHLDGWRDDFSATPRDELAARLGPPAPALRGPTLPAGARRLAVSALSRGGSVGLVAAVETRAGEFVPVELGRTRRNAPSLLGARLPRAARGGRVVSLRLLPPRRLVERGADSGRAAAIELVLGPLLADGRAVVPDYRGWVGAGGVEPRKTGARTTLRLALAEDRGAVFRPRQATDGQPLPALASTSLAAYADEDGELPLSVASERVVARVAGTFERFPGVQGNAVVLERSRLANALNATSPGSGFTTEIWLDADTPARADELERELARPPFGVLRLDSRSQLERRLSGEPIARASLALLAAAALTALVLALASLALGVLAELRDARGELLELEAQGVTPAELRRQLRLRALAVAAAGLLGGIVAGLVLGRVVVALVALTAAAELPEPPLVLTVDAGVLALGLAAASAIGVAIVAGAAATAFRGPVAARPEEPRR
jgi:hypothetical protein